MKLHDETAGIQELLGEYCRTGKEQEIPGVTPGRLKHYRRLVWNVVRDAMDSAFPIAKTALGEDLWESLVHNFFAAGVPRSPQLWKLPYEFYRFHEDRDTASEIGKPYLDDLLCFEWMEIEVHTMADRPVPAHTTEGDIFTGRLAFNPEFEIIRLEYPVHLYPAEQSIEKKGDYFVLIFRAPDTGYVHFLNFSGLNTYIVTRLAEEELPLKALKGEIASASGIESGTFLDMALQRFIGELMEKKLILGFRRD